MLDRTIPPAIKPFEYRGFPEYRSFFLRNGIEVIVIPFGLIPVMEVQLVIQTGHSYEQKNGVARAAFKLLTDGTSHYTASQLAEQLDGYGAEIACSVGYEQSTITLSVPTRHLADTLPLLYEVYFHASFPEEEWRTYQQRVLSNLEVEEKKTQAMAGRYFARRLWGQHPYGKTLTKEDFQCLSLEDIKAFHQNEILKHQVFILVAGHFEEEEVLALLERYGGDKAPGPAGAISLSKIIQPTTQKGQYLHPMEGQVQSSLRLGQLSVPRNHPDYDALQVLGTLIGGYFGSRLMQNIREQKGFTYGIYGGFVGMKEAGYFTIATDVANEYVDDTLSEIYKEITVLQNEKVSEAELQIVKNYLIGNILSSLETPFQVAEQLAIYKLNGLEVSHLADTLNTIQNIRSEDILALAQKYWDTSQWVTVIAGQKNTK